MNTIAMFALIIGINSYEPIQLGPFASIVSCEAARTQVAATIRSACIRIDMTVNK